MGQQLRNLRFARDRIADERRGYEQCRRDVGEMLALLADAMVEIEDRLERLADDEQKMNGILRGIAGRLN